MASQVIENDIRPLVNSGDIAGAITAFYQRSAEILSGEIPAGYATTSSSDDNSSTNFPYIGALIGFFLGLGLRRYLKK